MLISDMLILDIFEGSLKRKLNTSLQLWIVYDQNHCC
jgi:hypothetical protein